MKTPTPIAPPSARSGKPRRPLFRDPGALWLFVATAVVAAVAIVAFTYGPRLVPQPPVRTGDDGGKAVAVPVDVVPGPYQSDEVHFTDEDVAETQTFSFQGKSTLLLVVGKFPKKGGPTTVEITPCLDLGLLTVHAFRIGGDGARSGLPVESDGKKTLKVHITPEVGDKLHVFVGVKNTHEAIEVLETKQGKDILSTKVFAHE